MLTEVGFEAVFAIAGQITKYAIAAYTNKRQRARELGAVYATALIFFIVFLWYNEDIKNETI